MQQGESGNAYIPYFLPIGILMVILHYKFLANKLLHEFSNLPLKYEFSKTILVSLSIISFSTDIIVSLSMVLDLHSF